MKLWNDPTLREWKKMIEAKERPIALARESYYPDFNFKFAMVKEITAPGHETRDMLTRNGRDEHSHLLSIKAGSKGCRDKS